MKILHPDYKWNYPELLIDSIKNKKKSIITLVLKLEVSNILKKLNKKLFKIYRNKIYRI